MNCEAFSSSVYITLSGSCKCAADRELRPGWPAGLSIIAVYIKRCEVEFPRLQHRPVDHFRNRCLGRETRGHCELKGIQP